jgi:hypothetical protein
VSAPDKIDPARGWLYAEDLLAQEEAERVEKLSGSAIRDELRASGRDPDTLPSAKALLARTIARAKKPDAARGWAYVEKLSTEDAELAQAVARLEAMGKDELHHEVRDAGGDPAGLPSAKELLADVETRARRKQNGRAVAAVDAEPPEIATRPPARTEGRPLHPRWVVATAAAALLLIFALMNRRAIVAYFNGDEIRPDDQWLPWRPSPTPEQRAASIREDAYAACQQEHWQECKAKLDDAKRIDPAGDAQPRVVKVRQAIEEAQAADAGDPLKPHGK